MGGEGRGHEYKMTIDYRPKKVELKNWSNGRYYSSVLRKKINFRGGEDTWLSAKKVENILDIIRASWENIDMKKCSIL